MYVYIREKKKHHHPREEDEEEKKRDTGWCNEDFKKLHQKKKGEVYGCLLRRGQRISNNSGELVTM